MSSSLFSHSFSPPKSRKGMEIAISTLVVMVLGIVIIGGGMVLVGKMTGDGIDIAKDLTKDQEQQIAAMLNDGQLIAVYPSTQQITADKEGTFAIGILSTLDQTENFTLNVTSADIGSNWKVNYFDSIEVQPSTHGKALVSIRPAKNAPKGEYTFIVKMTYDEGAGPEIYDSPRFFTVRVQ